MMQGPDEPSYYRNRSTVRLITNVVHGLEVNEENRFLLKAWRGNMRTIWSDSDPSPRSGLGFGKKRDEAACDAVQAMRDATAADSHGHKVTSAALESAKKLQAHADNALGFLKSAQPLDDIIPDVFPSENMPNQPAARPKAAMWKHSQSLTEQVVRDVEDAMMNYIDEDPPTNASARSSARDIRRSTEKKKMTQGWVVNGESPR